MAALEGGGRIALDGTIALLEACSEAYMARVADSIDDLDLFSEEQDDLGAVVLESAHQLLFDPEGRVSLPLELIDHAGLRDQALFPYREYRMLGGVPFERIDVK